MATDDRILKKISSKESLLKDVEELDEIKIHYLKVLSNEIVRLEGVSISYSNMEEKIIEGFSMCIKEGECIFLTGKNGSGKSSLVKYIINEYYGTLSRKMHCNGNIKFHPNIKISYISQVIEWEDSTVEKYIISHNVDKSLFLAILTKLGVEPDKIRSKSIKDLSDGERKKIQLAISLITPANFYVWDEPLNYLDIYSRMQIENMILKYRPTMLIVDHDESFIKKCATKIVEI